MADWQTRLPTGSAPGAPSSRRSYEHATPRSAGGRRSAEPTPRSNASGTPRALATTPRRLGAKRDGKTPLRRRPSGWQDTTLEDADYALEEGEEQDLDFWGKMWRAAGYVQSAHGNYVPAEGGIVGGKLSDAELRLLVESEVDAQEKLLARDSEAGSNQHMDGGKKTHKMHRPALHADSAQDDTNDNNDTTDQEKLLEFARLADQEKASQLVGNYDKDRLGALINARDRFGWTAMHWLAEGCADDTEAKVLERKLLMMKMLLKYMSVLNLFAQTNHGNTPLVHAIWNDNYRACELLLKKEPRLPNVVSRGGWTALHWAANGQKRKLNKSSQHTHYYKPLPATVQLLLRRQYGMRVDDASQGGDTALHLATVRGFREVAQMLLQAGATVDARNLQGQTPLHAAAASDQPALVDLLVSFNANLGLEDREGHTPASLYAIKVVHTLRTQRYSDWPSLDEWDKKELEESFTKWLLQRNISGAILSPSVEPETVLAALSNTDSLQHEPDPLSVDDVNVIGIQIRTLRQLLLGDALPQ